MPKLQVPEIAIAKRIYFLGANFHKYLGMITCQTDELESGAIPKVLSDELIAHRCARPNSSMSLTKTQKNTWKITIDGFTDILVKKCATKLSLWDMSMTEYIAHPTLEQVGAWVGLGMTGIYLASRRERWPEERERESAKALDIAVEKRQEGVAAMVHKDFMRRKKILTDIFEDFEKQREELKAKGKFYVTNKDLMAAMSQERADTRLVMDIWEKSQVKEYIDDMKAKNILVEEVDDDS